MGSDARFPPGFGTQVPGLDPSQSALLAQMALQGNYAPMYAQPPNRSFGWVNVNPAATALAGFGDTNLIPSTFPALTQSAVDDNTGPWRRFTFTGALGVGFGGAMFSWSTNVWRPRDLPAIEFLFRTGGSLADLKIWLGFSGLNTTPNDNINGNAFQTGATARDGLGLKYSSGDGGYTDGTGGFFHGFASVDSGAFSDLGAVGAALAINTIYRCRCEILAVNTGVSPARPTSVRFTVNGASVTFSLAQAFTNTFVWSGLFTAMSHVNTKVIDVSGAYMSKQMNLTLP